MVDYFTQFSCVLDVGDADNAAAALAIHAQMAIDLEADDDIAIGFVAAVSSDAGLADPEAPVVVLSGDVT